MLLCCVRRLVGRFRFREKRGEGIAPPALGASSLFQPAQQRPAGARRVLLRFSRTLDGERYSVYYSVRKLVKAANHGR
jgi:hypothetical protein